MNEALKESLLLKSTHKPEDQGPGMCLELMMENSFRKLLSGKKAMGWGVATGNKCRCGSL